WIGCDINKGAIQTTAKRLQNLMHEQVDAKVSVQQGELLMESDDSEPCPAQLSFATLRVNDYDLQIQHNEAVQLACEYMGVTRTRADSYFDGSRGKRLVKIIPLNHPLTPLDLEDLREELHRRPDEERDIELICLGIEFNARAWVEEYNRNRPINKLHVIELRTDKKYGGFIKHEPLTVSASAERDGDKLRVSINDVLSPGILQRLNLERGVFRAQIEDWRAVVDCVLIDPDYDGEVFNVALSDIPARKQDLVEGLYELPLPRDGATVAIKVIDMLGEEAVVTQPV
ncbi:MAG: site-specific DNA-methyltransferase, partial [Sedimenticola sp.]